MEKNLDKKATYSEVISGTEGVEMYHGYAINPKDEKAFQSKEEVNEYIQSKYV